MARIGLAVGCVCVALACGYMFLAGFEYPGVTTWKVVTGGLAVLFLGLAVVAAAKGPSQ